MKNVKFLITGKKELINLNKSQKEDLAYPIWSLLAIESWLKQFYDIKNLNKMKQIIQDIKSGKTILEKVPVPSVGYGEILIKTKNTLVSLGTEKMLINFGKSGYIGKIKQQPEKFKLAINKIKSDGLKPFRGNI